jgi:hypothetical protein
MAIWQPDVEGGAGGVAMSMTRTLNVFNTHAWSSGNASHKHGAERERGKTLDCARD